jgi:hypothetical protein
MLVYFYFVHLRLKFSRSLRLIRTVRWPNRVTGNSLAAANRRTCRVLTSKNSAACSYVILLFQVMPHPCQKRGDASPVIKKTSLEFLNCDGHG